MRSLSKSLAVAALFVGVASCGPGNRAVELPTTGATLEGTITFGGEPVQFALVTLEAGGNTVMGKVGPEGRYKVTNAPISENVSVGVNTDAATGDYQSAAMAGGAYKGPEGKGKGKTNVKFVKVPAKFQSPKTSGIKVAVARGDNTHDIVIPK